MNIDGRIYLGTAIAAAVASAALLLAMPTSDVDVGMHWFSLRSAPVNDAGTQGIVRHESSVSNGLQVPRQWPARAPTRLMLARIEAEPK